ncbi:MAG: hypothetical protein QW703_01660 [Candidatus Aenigmatarchaeota archaeon]
MKGQMFLLTMILICGFIFSIYTYITQSTLDLSQPFTRDEGYYMLQIKRLYNQTFSACNDKKLAQLGAWLARQEIPSMYFQIRQDGDCSNLNVNITLFSTRATSTAKWSWP